MSLINSCNATFAQARATSSTTAFLPRCSSAGSSSAPPIDLEPPAEKSVGPLDRARTRRASRWPGSVRATCSPRRCRWRLIAEGIANNGVIKEPHVVQEVRNSDGQTVQHHRAQGLDDVHAAHDRGRAHQHDGRRRQRGAPAPRRRCRRASRSRARPAPRRPASTGENPHAWFIAFAPANAPRYAVAVIVEHGGDFGSEATGGEVAAPIAKQVLQNLLARELVSSLP